MSQPSDGPASVSTSYTRALLAGGLAGTTVDLSLYPLDTLKTRLQSQRGFLASGGFRGVYAGVGSALIGSAPGAALFFVSYEAVKGAFRDLHERRGDSGVTGGSGSEALEHMLAASVGEVAACAVRVPTEVVKQRAQARQAEGSAAALGQILAQRRTIGLGGVWRELYRGWGVTVMREVPFTVVQFPLWEALKSWRRRAKERMGVDTGDGSRAVVVQGWESGLAGCVSGAVAAGVTTPLDVLKTRLMLEREKVGALTMARRVMNESGAGAFFKGLGPRTLWIGIGGWVFLGSYQWALNVMGG